MKKTFFIASIVSLLLFITFIVYDVNAYATFSLFLFIILFGNLSGLIDEKERWNKGICKKTGEKWEYIDCEELSDESQMFIFKSKEYSYYSQYLTLEKLKKEYKGKNEF